MHRTITSLFAAMVLTSCSAVAGPDDASAAAETNTPVADPVAVAPPTSLVTLGTKIEGLQPPEGTVALTFDDGPSPRTTPAILDILDRYEATATFFIVGSLAQQHPALVTEIAARGHAVEAHSWSHAILTEVSEDQLRSEVVDTHELLTELTGVEPACVRPPEGETDALLDQWLERMGVAGLLWTVDTLDWTRPGSRTIVSRALRVEDRGVVLFHDGGGDRRQTAAALPAILEELGRRGLGTAQVCGPANARPPWDPPVDAAADPPGRPDAPKPPPPSTAPPTSTRPRDGTDDGEPPPPEDTSPLPTTDEIPTLPGP